MAARRDLVALLPIVAPALAALVAASCCLPLPLGNENERNPAGCSW